MPRPFAYGLSTYCTVLVGKTAIYGINCSHQQYIILSRLSEELIKELCIIKCTLIVTYLIFQYINTTGARVCLKELYESKYDPLSVSYTVLSGKNGFNIQIQPGLKAKLPLINLYFKSNNKLVIHKSVNLRAHSCDF